MMKPKVRAPNSKAYFETLDLMRSLKLHTVCEEAACPNIGECWAKKHATFMILGDTCTRACRFCNVKTGKPNIVDKDEPRHVAEAVARLQLEHVVITSVDRDDLVDGGASHFAQTIEMIRWIIPQTTIEILTPDFLRKDASADIIANAEPDVFNHNLETVPRLYRSVRPGARYFHSLWLLKEIKKKNPKIFIKSGLMVGLGEKEEEIIQVMDDLRSANVEFLTIGQYLQPTPKHHPVMDFISMDQFEKYARIALGKGFSIVSSSPLTRSSYHAGDHFKRLKASMNI